MIKLLVIYSQKELSVSASCCFSLALMFCFDKDLSHNEIQRLWGDNTVETSAEVILNTPRRPGPRPKIIGRTTLNFNREAIKSLKMMVNSNVTF